MPNMEPGTWIKIVWLVHFALTSWALLSAYLSVPAYMFTQLGVLACGFWAVVTPENRNALLMFLTTLCISLINDSLLIGLYEPRGHSAFESSNVKADLRNEYRFALGMSIVNLILKPVSIVIVFIAFRNNTSDRFNFNIPGLSGQRKDGGSSNRPGTGDYKNIESPQESYPGIYGRSPQPYQSSPTAPQPVETKPGPQ